MRRQFTAVAVIAVAALLAGCANPFPRSLNRAGSQLGYPVPSTGTRHIPNRHTTLPGVHPARIVAATQLSAPKGSASVTVPDGWALQPGSQSDNPFAVAAGGGTGEPAVTVWGLAPISDFVSLEGTPSDEQCYANIDACTQQLLQAEAAGVARPYTAAESAQILLPVIRQLGLSDARLTAVTPAGDQQATYRYAYTRDGHPVESEGVIVTRYWDNPVASAVLGGQRYSTFAFVTGCEAPAGQLDEARATCAQVLASFHPRQNWLEDEAAAYVNRIDQQLQMIGQTLSRIQQSQYEEQLSLLDTNYRVAEGWSKALGTTVDLIDPASGHVYETHDDYAYYCLNPAGQGVGTDDAGVLETPSCATVLKRR
jgi:hypothetical protein